MNVLEYGKLFKIEDLVAVEELPYVIASGDIMFIVLYGVQLWGKYSSVRGSQTIYMIATP